MAKNNPKSVVRSAYPSFADPAVSNKAWKRYKNYANSTELTLKDPSSDKKVNIEGFTNWTNNQTLKNNK